MPNESSGLYGVRLAWQVPINIILKVFQKYFAHNTIKTKLKQRRSNVERRTKERRNNVEATQPNARQKK